MRPSALPGSSIGAGPGPVAGAAAGESRTWTGAGPGATPADNDTLRPRGLEMPDTTVGPLPPPRLKLLREDERGALVVGRGLRRDRRGGQAWCQGRAGSARRPRRCRPWSWATAPSMAGIRGASPSWSASSIEARSAFQSMSSVGASIASSRWRAARCRPCGSSTSPSHTRAAIATSASSATTRSG